MPIRSEKIDLLAPNNRSFESITVNRMGQIKRSGFSPQGVIILQAKVVGKKSIWLLGEVDHTKRFYYLQTRVILQQCVILPPGYVRVTQVWDNVASYGVRVKLQLGLKPLRCYLTHSVYSDFATGACCNRSIFFIAISILTFNVTFLESGVPNKHFLIGTTVLQSIHRILHYHGYFFPQKLPVSNEKFWAERLTEFPCHC